MRKMEIKKMMKFLKKMIMTKMIIWTPKKMMRTKKATNMIRLVLLMGWVLSMQNPKDLMLKYNNNSNSVLIYKKKGIITLVASSSSNSREVEVMKKESKVKKEGEVTDSKTNNTQILQAAICKILDKEIVEEDNREAINNMFNNKTYISSNYKINLMLLHQVK